MYKNKYNTNDFETHKLEVTLIHKGGGWDYKSMPKVQMKDTTTNKKYSPYQFQQWLETPHIMAMIRKGANLKIATQDFEDNPNKYDDGKRRRIIFYFSALKNQPPKTQSVDGCACSASQHAPFLPATWALLGLFGFRISRRKR